MPGKIIFRELEVEGFRYISSRLLLNLNYDLIILVGPVGSGKSSVLNAIEFALFGTTYDVKAMRILRIDDLINDFRKEMHIRLKLLDEEGNIYDIIRYKELGKRPRVRIYKNGITILKGYSTEKVNEFIKDLIGLDLEDFSRQIYIRHREIEALIYGTPAQRSEAIDRLFGIEILERVFRDISIKIFEDEINRSRIIINELQDFIKSQDKEGIERELEEINRKIKEIEEKISYWHEQLRSYEEEIKKVRNKRKVYEEVRNRIAEYKAVIKKLKDEVEHLSARISPSEALLKVEKLKTYLANLLISHLEYGRAEKIKEFSIDEENITDFIQMVTDAIDFLDLKRSELVDDLYRVKAELESLRNNRKVLLERLSRLISRQKDLGIFERQYHEYIAKYGTVSDIRKELRNIDKKIAELNGMIEYENSLITVVKEIIRRGMTKCPICGRPLSKEMLQKIEKSVLKSITQECSHLIDQFNELNNRKRELNRVLDELVDLERSVNEKKLIDLEIQDLRNEIESIDRKIDEYERLIEDIEEKVHELEVAKGRIKEDMDYIVSFTNFITKQRELEKLENELKTLQEKLREISYDENYERTLYELMNKIERQITNLESEKKILEEKKKNLEKALSKLKTTITNLILHEKRLKALEKEKERLMLIKNAFRSTQTKLRETMLRQINELMNNIFKRIYVYPDFKELSIKVERTISSEKYEKSIYEIYAYRTSDRTWVPAMKKLSDGQKAIVTLSFLMALFMSTPHNLSVMILDDPIPNVDNLCKEALIRLLSKLENVRQIIIATQDSRLVKVLEESSRELESKLRACVYEFKHGVHGPIVKFKEITTK